MQEHKLKTISNLFEGKEIPSIWDKKKEDYYFSVVDVIGALAEANIPRNYWSDLKRKLKQEGSQLHENIVQLKMIAQDGKMRITDTLDTEGIFRLIESVSSPKAEPFKLWLAKLGRQEVYNIFYLSKGIDKIIAKIGGSAAKAARDNIEENLGKSLITKDNQLNYQYIDENNQIENK